VTYIHEIKLHLKLNTAPCGGECGSKPKRMRHFYDIVSDQNQAPIDFTPDKEFPAIYGDGEGLVVVETNKRYFRQVLAWDLGRITSILTENNFGKILRQGFNYITTIYFEFIIQ
jgi:hypothetical protein